MKATHFWLWYRTLGLGITLWVGGSPYNNVQWTMWSTFASWKVVLMDNASRIKKQFVVARIFSFVFQTILVTTLSWDWRVFSRDRCLSFGESYKQYFKEAYLTFSCFINNREQANEPLTTPIMHSTFFSSQYYYWHRIAIHYTKKLRKC